MEKRLQNNVKNVIFFYVKNVLIVIMIYLIIILYHQFQIVQENRVLNQFQMKINAKNIIKILVVIVNHANYLYALFV
jgi:hypothetical protein